MNSLSGVKSDIPVNALSVTKKVREEVSIKNLPLELQAKIYSLVGLSGLWKVCSLDKGTNAFINASTASSPSFKERIIHRDGFFTSRDWKKYCGKDVDTEGESSSLPSKLYEMFNSPCRVFPGKKIGQTHMFVWMPKMMNGEPLTIRSYANLLEEKFPGNNVLSVNSTMIGLIGGNGVSESGWVLMTRKVVPGSIGVIHETQERLVSNIERQSWHVCPSILEPCYKVPSTLEAIICFSTEYFKFGKGPFNELIRPKMRTSAGLGANKSGGVVGSYPNGVAASRRL